MVWKNRNLLALYARWSSSIDASCLSVHKLLASIAGGDDRWCAIGTSRACSARVRRP